MATQNKSESEQGHYIGIDVGTGSARACIMNSNGDIVGLASKDIALWQPEPGYYVCFPDMAPLAMEHHCSITDILDSNYEGAINNQHMGMHLLVNPPCDGAM